MSRFSYPMLRSLSVLSLLLHLLFVENGVVGIGGHDGFLLRRSGETDNISTGAVLGTSPTTTVATLECSACKELASAISKFGHNDTSVSRVIALLQGDLCDKVFPQSNGTLNRLCDKLVSGLVDLAPGLEKELDSLAWDITNICAALEVCTVPCCSHSTTPEQVCVFFKN